MKKEAKTKAIGFNPKPTTAAGISDLSVDVLIAAGASMACDVPQVSDALVARPIEFCQGDTCEDRQR
jgi:hypothetical protein